MLGRRSVGALVGAAVGSALLPGCDIIPPSGWALDLVTVSADGTDGGNQPTIDSPKFSADGTKMLFTTPASNLGPNDTNDAPDVYMRDLTTETTTLVSRNAAGTDAGNSGSGQASFDADATRVVFASHATDLGPVDTDLAADIYVRDLTTGAVTRIDPGAHSCGSAHSSGPMFSPDGNKIAFTRDWWLDGNMTDLFVHDLRTQTTVQVSRHQGAETCVADSRSGFATFSSDGTLIGFISTANDLGPVDSGDPTFLNDAQDVYLYDLDAETTTLVSVDATGTEASNGVSEGFVTFSPDGTKVFFPTNANNLGPTDTNNSSFFPDVYVRDLVAETTDLVSANADGTDSAMPIGSRLSPDATKLAFASPLNTLGPGDSDSGILDGLDVYVRDLTTGAISLISVNAAGTDSGNKVSGAPMFVGGNKIVFASQASDLVPTDTDTETDLYLRDLSSGATTLLSGNANGTGSGNGEVRTGFASASDDGSTIAFVTSGSNHGARDTNGFEDIYVVEYHDRADLLVTVDPSTDPVPSGGEVTYDVNVVNAGPESAHDAKLIAVLPEGTTLVDAEAAGGECSEPVVARPDIVVCDLGDLEPDAEANATIAAHVTAPAGSDVTTLIGVGATTFDPVRDNNVAEVHSTVGAPSS